MVSSFSTLWKKTHPQVLKCWNIWTFQLETCTNASIIFVSSRIKSYFFLPILANKIKVWKTFQLNINIFLGLDFSIINLSAHLTPLWSLLSLWCIPLVVLEVRLVLNHKIDVSFIYYTTPWGIEPVPNWGCCGSKLARPYLSDFEGIKCAMFST